MYKGYKTGVRKKKKDIKANELTNRTMLTLNENELSDLRDIQNSKMAHRLHLFQSLVD